MTETTTAPRSTWGSWVGDFIVLLLWSGIWILDLTRIIHKLPHMGLLDGLTCGMVVFIAPVLVAKRCSKIMAIRDASRR